MKTFWLIYSFAIYIPIVGLVRQDIGGGATFLANDSLISSYIIRTLWNSITKIPLEAILPVSQENINFPDILTSVNYISN